MLRIVVTGDTHMPKKAKELPSRLLEELATADMIIHTGDWSAMDVYHTFAKYGKVYGVHGNVEGEEMKQLFPVKQIIQANGFNIGITHGGGEKKTTEKRALEAFEGEDIDLLIFGHSHIPLLRYFKKLLLFNPGSPTDKRRLPYYSFGIILIDEEIRAEHVFFK